MAQLIKRGNETREQWLGRAIEMMRPECCSIMAGSTALANSIGPVRLTARTSSQSARLRLATGPVGPMWLAGAYALHTVGELMLSPVGLSMVSKLAPAKFATMLMGVWMLTSAFGNFAAGALGEDWGTTPPVWFFLRTTIVAGGAALVLLLLVRVVTKTMHGVK